MTTPLLHRVFVGLPLIVALSACTVDYDDVGLDAAPGEVGAGDEGLWTQVEAPPYDAAGVAMTRRVLELKPDAAGDITLVAALRWNDSAAGAIDPQVTFSLASDQGESTLLQIFESGGVLRTRFDLEMTDVLQVGGWYRVVLTIADAPGRPMQVRLFGADGAEVWRSCGDGAARCPSAPIDASAPGNLRLVVSVDDARFGQAHVELKDVSLVRQP
jgi:hypothetical protein